MLTLADGLLGNTLPPGFAHDVSRSNLGHGPQTFEAARDAFLHWQQFALGWVQVLNPGAEIAPGQLIGIEVHTACLWSVIFNHIVETVDTPTRFGFMYATTALHVERVGALFDRSRISSKTYSGPHRLSLLASDAASIRERFTRTTETLRPGSLR
jgi:uncharacterized protein (UPF0548 family)